MHKKTKWAITALILVVAIGLGTYRLMREKKPDAGIDAPPASSRANILNVNAQIVREQELSDGIFTIATLLPDEEVDLTFETSGKIEQINFTEGTVVRKGDLLAKVNDKPLQAQLSKFEAQLKLAEDRVYRQKRTARKGCRQPGSLRTGAHRTGDPERRHRPGQSQYRPDRTARAVRRDHRLRHVSEGLTLRRR